MEFQKLISMNTIPIACFDYREDGLNLFLYTKSYAKIMVANILHQFYNYDWASSIPRIWSVVDCDFFDEIMEVCIKRKSHDWLALVNLYDMIDTLSLMDNILYLETDSFPRQGPVTRDNIYSDEPVLNFHIDGVEWVVMDLNRDDRNYLESVNFHAIVKVWTERHLSPSHIIHRDGNTFRALTRYNKAWNIITKPLLEDFFIYHQMTQAANVPVVNFTFSGEYRTTWQNTFARFEDRNRKSLGSNPVIEHCPAHIFRSFGSVSQVFSYFNVGSIFTYLGISAETISDALFKIVNIPAPFLTEEELSEIQQQNEKNL